MGSRMEGERVRIEGGISSRNTQKNKTLYVKYKKLLLFVPIILYLKQKIVPYWMRILGKISRIIDTITTPILRRTWPKE